MNLTTHRNPSIPKVAIIVVAAGASRRLGSPKQLVTYKGKTLLRRTLESAQESKAKHTFLVHNQANHFKFLEGSPESVISIYNEQWEEGMGKSISIGIQALSSYDIEAVIISVCDQPHIEADIFDKLIDKYHTSKHPCIINCRYGDQNFGPPVLFDQQYFDELCALSGDKGGNSIITSHMDHLCTVDFDKGYIDIDTPEDLANLEVD